MSAALLAGFWELAEDFAVSRHVIAFDTAVNRALESWRPHWLTTVMTVVTAAGSTIVVLAVALLLIVVLLRKKRYGEAIFSAGVTASGGILSWVAKGSFARARPPAVDALIPLPLSFSFPSGHTTGSFCLAYVIAYLALRSHWRPWAKSAAIVAAFAYTLAVGVSRVYLGVHWPSDVVAGWLLGGAIAAAATGAMESVH